MKILAISCSARRNSTNTAMLQSVRSVAPNEIEISIFDGVGRLPVFRTASGRYSPSRSGENTG
ncbi:NAD(P)H-dependent oxidoreductase, partial [Rhizobium leguminosarum]|uniref:NAD(P)H-dependent oxidoreductase n=1 Tax=Rhizobium leguminosarum TaxID=384 RepID=UPI003F971AA3